MGDDRWQSGQKDQKTSSNQEVFLADLQNDGTKAGPPHPNRHNLSRKTSLLSWRILKAVSERILMKSGVQRDFFESNEKSMFYKSGTIINVSHCVGVER